MYIVSNRHDLIDGFADNFDLSLKVRIMVFEDFQIQLIFNSSFPSKLLILIEVGSIDSKDFLSPFHFNCPLTLRRKTFWYLTT